ncbi:uncharacterized protein [Drosophila pseudoobscura]|uniref:F-box domain-containing protein n=1 Tax=Drosophila pseudoobscura pseudoobscura TaxID=46245 RepID=A0A6I8VQK1_DROPS|nr:uncharacterized protein LOC26533232 [Drosophila pseudoobscura]XP_033233010.1 uncharacterized protein LOC26533232 [Drosophila pseudoobscura]
MLPNLPLEFTERLFKYLSEKDKLRWAQVNKQLGCVFAYHAKEKYKSLFVGEEINSNEGYTDNELRVILTFCGSTVENISIQRVKVMDQLGELIEKNCINLKHAGLMITDENVDALKRVVNMRGIEKLSLDVLHYSGSDLLQHVNPYCKDLKLENISMGQEQHIKKLIHLEKLDVQSKEARNMFEICSHLPRLREFTTNRFEYPSDVKQDYLYPELESLTLINFEMPLDLPVCPKLKKFTLLLTVCNAENIADIISKYGDTLEHLDIACE